MSEGRDFSEAERQAVYRAIHERRDVRSYRPDPVPEETLQRILEAAHHAPSVGFMQPWSFVLIRDRTLRTRIYAHFAEVNTRAAEVFGDARRQTYQALKLQGILDAPLNLLVTCDPDRAGTHVLGRFTMPETDVYSTCLAVQNLWLAARAEGVGVGWMSIMEPRVVAELLHMPEAIVPVAYLTLGYPVEFSEKPMLSQVGWQQRRPLSELVFEDRWGRPAPTPPVRQSAPAPHDHGPSAPDTRHEIAPAPAVPAQALARNAALTKPAGSMGAVEALALRLCALQGTQYPRCEQAHLTLFAGDHGLTAQRVSAYKPDTTLKLVYAYLAGGGVINALCRQQAITLHVVDVGVDHEFGEARGLLKRKVRRGTRDITEEAAMTSDECAQALTVGREVVRDLASLHVLLPGEVGIGNSTSAAALAAALLDLTPEQTTGRGTGIDADGLARKQRVIARALSLHASQPRSPDELLRRLGGFEIAAMVGAIEGAAARGALILLDGMITAVAGLIAVRRTPAVASYLVASHRSPEPAHARLLEALTLRPLLELDMRLGEGSGAALAMSLLRAGCAIMREVRTFEEANIARPEYSDRQDSR